MKKYFIKLYEKLHQKLCPHKNTYLLGHRGSININICKRCNKLIYYN